MNAFLTILQLLSLPLMAIFAIAYFIALHGYKEKLKQEFPDLWKTEHAKARPLEPWMPAAYKFLQRTKKGVLNGQAVSARMLAAQTKAKRWLYTSAITFMVFLFSSLILELLSGG